MVGGEAAFAGGEPDAAHLGAAGEGSDGGVAEGAGAHAGDVEEAGGIVGFDAGTGALGDADAAGGPFGGFLLQHAEGGGAEGEGGGGFAAEGDEVRDALGGAVDPGAFEAVERAFDPIGQVLVLPHVFAEAFGEVAEMADDGVVAQDGVAGLAGVVDIDGGNQGHGHQQQHQQNGHVHASRAPGRSMAQCVVRHVAEW